MSFKKEIRDKLGSIDNTLIEQHVTLKDHIRRTELLEARIPPIEKFMSMVTGAVKLIVLCGVIAGIVETIHQVLSK